MHERFFERRKSLTIQEIAKGLKSIAVEADKLAADIEDVTREIDDQAISLGIAQLTVHALGTRRAYWTFQNEARK